MNGPTRRTLSIVLGVAVLVMVVVYRDTFGTMAAKWLDDAAFTYGVVVAPISLWLAWRKRDQLARVPLVPSWLGVTAMALCAGLWVIARGTGVAVVEQFAVVAMISALALAVLGLQATRVLAFPLAFLIFMVPFGRAIVPWLMQATADMATLALQSSGIPVHRSHTYLTIPGGSFEVARACSGVAFLMTAFVLGVLYAYLNYSSWKKRLLCVLAAVTVPVLANGVRVYITIAISYLTDMRFGPGVEHLTFAQVFFVVVLLGMFWLGRRWQDDAPARRTENAQWLVSHRPAPAKWATVALALAILVGAPWYYTAAAARMQASLADASTAVMFPTGGAKWLGPIAGHVGWRPLYRDGLVERQGTYRRGDSAPVDVFVAVYAPGLIVGTEMISYENLLYAEEHVSLAKVDHRRIELAGGGVLNVREVIVPDSGSQRLVWHWYVYGDRSLTSGFAIKALEAMSWLTRDANLERIVTLATAYDDTAHDRLRSFLDAHSRCIASGFAVDACAG